MTDGGVRDLLNGLMSKLPGRPSRGTTSQPRVPGSLGCYNLRDPAVRAAQAQLAEEYGIHGFCYYHYWFNGKQLLEQPFNEVLSSGEPDFPFCLCWANENWTRAWDGLNREILIAQDYANYDVEQHVDSLTPAFTDPRYIRVNGHPLFLIYRADQIPRLSSMITRFRNRAAANGIKQLHICADLSPVIDTKFLGEASYAIYLIHPAVIVLLEPYLILMKNLPIPVDLSFLLSFFVVMFSVCSISFAVHKYFEMPAYFWGVSKAKQIESSI